MLGKLVNKFKKHSLQEEITTGSGATVNANTGNNGTAATAPLSQLPYRRSARISALYGVSFSCKYIFVFVLSGFPSFQKCKVSFL